MVSKKNSSAKDLQAGGGDVRPVKVIRSEKGALDVLSDLNNRPGELTFQIKFEGWPVLTTNLKGNKFDSSITSRVMTGYLALQQELNRSYTIVKFGEERQPNLSREERDELELEVHVSDTQQQITCPLQDDTLDARYKSKISNALNSRKQSRFIWKPEFTETCLGT
ncbi:hypothetical protein ACOTEY_25950 [Achromobacter xylosoxidans]